MDADVDMIDPDFPWQDYGDIPEEVLEQMMQQYQDYYGGGEFGFEEPPAQVFSYAEHFANCVVPTLTQGIQIITPLVFGCMAMRTVSLMGLPAAFYHLLSLTVGILALSYFFEGLIIQVVALGLLGYFLLQACQASDINYKGPVSAAVFVMVLVIWELFFADPVEWNKIRGSQMILVMKVISLAFDLDQGVVEEVPEFLAYLGYTFNLATVIFGPWISFSAYLRLLHPGGDIELRWLLTAFVKFLQSLVCLLISTCVAPVLFLGFDQKWLDAYKDAMSFRFSHYFVSFVSESTSLALGLGAPREGGNKYWELNVARPWHIELPRSLVQVVTNWNLPMHVWLKNYVFKTSRKFGNFAAVLLTYAASSLLHGLNFQLAAVLLSLGFYSYIEHVFRQKLASIFNACILARRCKQDCQHLHQSTHPLVMLTNLCFGLLAMFHLAYLGVMFNSEEELQEKGYEMEHTLKKWSHLDYASHYVAATTFVFYWLIK
ncbi:protein-serine O-palmitoleoyltransferase porcupine-like isoform X2 [Acanthaster planci]|nr:protein-serine O-palmitoleoyltransferase porcupine-like isoform X2 [Acanthaster planci]XP_022107838.1 protein-serine O-palmitoleoyltransferase porcupine-like isoform X2 [Acanthaster planci]XP_022107840.1 protein-serine O-palmitoleoyltransferase porcupine-like isoform X2 [Acanthaster planci]XP_022107841.1 protein-serine O-palmitoleoyltransferase porcupine-like isoform X2 [Acanthaster planci]XP_022107842.1 protein-serine O-palmitoleoyltransferase porcupine-like isoform X2 [Acanthaster planci]